MVEYTKAVRETLAKAIWEAEKKKQIGIISPFDFDETIFPNIVPILKVATPREEIIVSFSLIAKCLDAALRFHLSHSNKKDQKDLLEGLGPLATDAAKLKFLRVIGWLPQRTSEGIECIRKVRNRVSHSIDPGIDLRPKAWLTKEVIEHLDGVIDSLVEAVNTQTTTKLKPELGKTFSGYAMLLAMYCVEEVVAAPSKRILGVSGGSTFYGADDQPEWSRRLRVGFADGLIALCQ